MKEIHRIVGLLPKEYRIPFAMHVSGFKYREIAEKLGLPLGTVKSRIFLPDNACRDSSVILYNQGENYQKGRVKFFCSAFFVFVGLQYDIKHVFGS